MPIEEKLKVEWATGKYTTDGVNPKVILKGTDHEYSVEFKLTISFNDGTIPTEYQKILGRDIESVPGNEVTMILGPKSMQTQLGDEEDDK